MTYSVVVLSAAARTLAKLPSLTRERLRRSIDALADNPRPAGARKLSGQRDLFRIRAGDCRVIYEIQDERLIVLVVKVGHRRDVYR